MIKKFFSHLLNGILAGLCIALGGSVFLACDNKYIGALLFCVALLTICSFSFSLYTGKIGLIVENHKKEDFIVVTTALLGNALSCAVFGLMIKEGLPALSEKSAEICLSKLAQFPSQTFIRGIFCGVLMYVAVWIYSNKKSIAGILFCVPVFILSGFEHSIADMFYFATANNFSKNAAVFLLLVVFGNTVGGILIPLLVKIKKALSD